MSSSDDDNKPRDVRDETWKQHLEWMRVMESSRHYGPPMKKLMDDYFLPPRDDSSSQGGDDS